LFELTSNGRTECERINLVESFKNAIPKGLPCECFLLPDFALGDMAPQRWRRKGREKKRDRPKQQPGPRQSGNFRRNLKKKTQQRQLQVKKKKKKKQAGAESSAK